MIKIGMRTVLAAALLLPSALAFGDAAGDFKRGQDLLKSGKVHEACQAFEDSEKADAKADTEVALAGCYEQDGRVFSASKMYKLAADKDTNAARKKTSAEKATKLDAQASKLRITLSQKPDGLVIKVDGVVVPNEGTVQVDAGPHEVIATAPGYEGHAKADVDKDKKTVDVIVRMEKKEEAPPPPTNPPPTNPPPTNPPPTGENPQPPPTDIVKPPPPMHAEGGGHKKRNGAIIGVVGVASLVTGVVFFSASSGKFDDEHKLCPNSKCGSQADLDTAHGLLDDGHTFRGLAYGFGIGGLALVGVGGYLFFTASKGQESHMSLNVDHKNGGGSVVWTGHF